MQEHHKSTIELYQQMDEKYGPDDVRSLTWGSPNTQETRFEQLLRLFNLRNMVLLDAGCGHGDLYEWLLSREFDFGRYVGMDLCEHHIEYANNKYPWCEFIHGSIPEVNLPEVDITFASGTFGFDSPEWESITRAMIDKMFAVSRIGLCFNMQSKWGLPPVILRPLRRNLDPCFWFEYAMKISGGNACLLHDYLKADFTIGVYHV